MKRPALGLQLGAQFPEIVDFAVEREGPAAVLALHRLRAADEVDDREAAMAEHGGAGSDHAVVVRAARSQGVHRAMNMLAPAGTDHAEYAAHTQCAPAASAS